MTSIPVTVYRCGECNHTSFIASHGDSFALCPDHGMMEWVTDFQWEGGNFDYEA